MPAQIKSFQIDHPTEEDTSSTQHTLAISNCKILKFNSIPQEELTDTTDYMVNSTISNIVDVNIADGITELADGAFAFATNLTSVVIPASVTKIGLQLFYGCTNLKHVVIKSAYTDDLFKRSDGEYIIGYFSDGNTKATITTDASGANMMFDGKHDIGYGEVEYFGEILLEVPNMTVDEITNFDSDGFLFCSSAFSTENDEEILIHIKDSSGKTYKIFQTYDEASGTVSYTKEEI